MLVCFSSMCEDSRYEVSFITGQDMDLGRDIYLLMRLLAAILGSIVIE